MATHDYSIANQSFPATRSDINNALAAIKSSNSAAAAPTSSLVEGQLFYDTTNDVLKVYNGTAFNDVALDSGGDLNVTGSLSLAGTAITSTAAELNILDGVTATATELNLLDGVTATTAEINYLDGVTSNIQTQIDNIDTNTTFYLEDGDGTEVAINQNKEVKFVEDNHIDINWTDTSDGSDSDPYDLTFSIKSGTNGYGTRTISTSAPSGGSSGDIWYRY